MTAVVTGRFTHDSPEHDQLTVFLIGMRFNKFRRLDA